MLRQIKWGVQNGPITKNRRLPVNTLFFRKFCFQFKYLVWRVDLNSQLPKCPHSYFWKALGFYLRVFFPCEYLEKHCTQKMKDSKDCFSKYDQIRRKLRIGPHLLKKSYSGWPFSWLLTDEGRGWAEKPPFPKICYTYPTIMKFGRVIPWPKEDRKDISITWHTPWILSKSRLFHRKSANFAISENTGVDSILVHNF